MASWPSSRQNSAKPAERRSRRTRYTGGMKDRRATYALAILTFINLFNYVDRWVLSAVVEPIKKELGFSDTQLGIIAAGFIIVYSATSPIFGILGDVRKRPPLIAIGVAIWSLATG